MVQLKHAVNIAYQQKSVSHLQIWHHATLRAPVIITLIRAINKIWLTSFPGLTATGVQKHLPKSIQTTMGHLHKSKEESSTNKKVTAEGIMEDIVENPSEDYLPPRKKKNSKHIVQVTAVEFEDLKETSLSDQTGEFP